MITKAINSKANLKQSTNADFPQVPSQITTNFYGPVTSTAGQTIITLSFAVTVANQTNFQLKVNGQDLAYGASFDYTFTNVQANGTSTQITLNQPLAAGLVIQAIYFGVFQPSVAASSLATLQAQVSAIQSAQPTNSLINSAFDFWQRGTSFSVASSASTYGADRWWLFNGSGAAMTYSQTTGSVPGSKYGASISYGTSATSSTCGIYQAVENFNSLPFYGQTLSFGVWVKALGNTNQVTLYTAYATTETKTATAALSTQNFTINSSGFTYCQLPAVSVGTAIGSGGVIIVGVLPGTASTGNAYASGNGIVIEQAMLNLGTTVGNFTRAGRNIQEELSMCQRYYEKSYDIGTAPGTVTTNGQDGINTGVLGTTSQHFNVVTFKATKRTVPTTVIYDNAGTSGKISTLDAGGTSTNGVTIGINLPGTRSALVGPTNGTYAGWQYSWTADADI